MVSLSVIIATCGRPERLAKCLDAVEVALRTWGGEGEVIVVDNHPKYEAEAVVRGVSCRVHGASCFVRGASELRQSPSIQHQAPSTKHQPPTTKHPAPSTPHQAPSTKHQAPLLESRIPNPIPPTTYLRSAPFNKAKALNAGIAAAQGKLLAFTDDDCLPEPDWLREGVGFLTGRVLRVCGGRVVNEEPDFNRLPRWLHADARGRLPPTNVIVRYDPLPATGFLAAGQTVPFGSNIFAAATVFRDHGGYDEELWDLCVRRRKWPLGSEDSEFGHRLMQRGELLGYCREARVWHPVNYGRTDFRTQLRQAYCDGWRHPLIFIDEYRRMFEPFRVRRGFVCLASAVGSWVHGDRPGAGGSILEAVRLAGATVGRWSGAFRERRSAITP